MSNKAHCARPGCRVAKLVHGQPGSCGNYIDPDSDAGRAILRAERKAPKLRLVPPDEEETVDIDPPSDAELLADWQRTGEML